MLPSKKRPPANWVVHTLGAFLTLSTTPGSVCAQSQGERVDPRVTIRALIKRGMYYDAHEAILGLPDSVRPREEAFLRFQCMDFPSARAFALRALKSEANDTELLRMLGDIEVMDGRQVTGQQYYQKARAALTSDPRLQGDADREEEARILTYRDLYVTRETDYRTRVRSAERRTETLANLGFILVGSIGALALYLGHAGGSRAKNQK